MLSHWIPVSNENQNNVTVKNGNNEFAAYSGIQGKAFVKVSKGIYSTSSLHSSGHSMVSTTEITVMRL